MLTVLGREAFVLENLEEQEHVEEVFTLGVDHRLLREELVENLKDVEEVQFAAPLLREGVVEFLEKGPE